MSDAFAPWSHIVDRIWSLNLQAALLALIVGIVCLLGRRWLSPNWRSILWMLVFLRLVVPNGPSSIFSLENIVVASFPTRAAYVSVIELTRSMPETGPFSLEIAIESGPQMPAPIIEAVPARTNTITEIAASRWSARNVCAAIWLMVAALLLGRLGWLRIQLSRQLSRLELIRQLELIQMAESVARNAKLTRVPRLLWGASDSGPAICGWLFPVLILPRKFPVLEPLQMRAVLLHEFRHIRTADTLLTWLPHILCATFWFNPLLWYVNRRWHEERELACDEWVLRQIGRDQKRLYLETLVAIATRTLRSPSLKLTTSIVSSSNILERRIIAMKRFRPSTWTGLIAGPLLTILAVAMALTDAAQAQNETAKELNLGQAPSASADQDTAGPAVNQQKTTQAAPQANTLKPKIVFAQHVILWEGTRVLTRDQLKELLAKLRETQSVKPNVYHSLGFVFTDSRNGFSEAKANERANQAVLESLELVGRDQWSMMSFLSRRGSGAVDRIRTEDDLKTNSAQSLKGRVVVSDSLQRAIGQGIDGKPLTTTAPAKRAQVVILPIGEPCVVRLRDGILRDPADEFWYETNAEGMFEADPASLVFDPVLLYGDGKYLTLILHESGCRVINGQLAASDATYELLPWTNVTIDARNIKANEQFEISMTPEGAHEKFPELSIGWVSHSDQPVSLKLPRGKGRADYWIKVGDQWNVTNIRHPIQISADGPTEITIPPAPVKQ